MSLWRNYIRDEDLDKLRGKVWLISFRTLCPPDTSNPLEQKYFLAQKLFKKFQNYLCTRKNI